MKPDVCMICREHNSVGNDLSRLAYYLQWLPLDVDGIRGSHLQYFWDYKPCCKYGMNSCSKLDQFARQNFDLISRVIEPGIAAVIKSGNTKYYTELLRYLNGKFSRVYCQVEQDWRKKDESI